MAESVKQPLSYSRITNVLSSVGGKITIPTTSNYIEHCEDAWLLLRLHNINAAFAERETNSKYYFIDNGLLSLLLVDPTTTLLENIVALTLFRKYGNDKDNERIFFYNQNMEVDFYIPEEELAIQVSYSIESSDTTENREVEVLAVQRIITFTLLCPKAKNGQEQSREQHHEQSLIPHAKHRYLYELTLQKYIKNEIDMEKSHEKAQMLCKFTQLSGVLR